MYLNGLKLCMLCSLTSRIKLEIDKRRKFGKCTNMWKLAIVLTKKGQKWNHKEFKKHFAMNKNERIIYQNMWAQLKQW